MATDDVASTATATRAVSSTAPSGRSLAASLTDRQWDELTDAVIRRLERRATDELSRRGRLAQKRAL